MKKQRVQKVVEKMTKMGLEQILITDPLAVFYLTGRHTEPGERFYGLYINKHGDNKLFINNLFDDPKVDDLEVIFHSDAVSPMPQLAGCLDASKTLGVDKNLAARFLVPMLKDKIVSDVVVASYCVDEARAVKDAEEMELMRRASEINDSAMAKFKELLIEGVTEKEVANQMLDIYRNLGAQGYSFDPIVAFGVNTVSSHHVPDDTPLKEGDVVLLDVGCKKDWYCADMTRVFFYKHEPAGEVKHIYELARKATETAENMCAPGVKFADIDAAARNVIADAGYGHTFVHRTGHFIGLEDHDFGDVSALNSTPAVCGNVFSIEPSIAIEGKVKIYIEDLVMITENGREVLNKYSHDISVIE